jgi:hypothetical protein
MIKLIYLLIFTLGISSCSSDDTEKIENTDLIGKWNWTNTDGGIAFHIHETPETTGKIIHLNLMEDYTYSTTVNGSEISKGMYELTLKKSIHSGELERYITLQTIDQLYLGFVKNGIVNVNNNDRLEISDNMYDGIGSQFVRIE